MRNYNHIYQYMAACRICSCVKYKERRNLVLRVAPMSIIRVGTLVTFGRLRKDIITQGYQQIN
jgi:hypothetical protein